MFGLDSERKQLERAIGRLPPGPSLTLKWPVLHEGSVPALRSEDLGFSYHRPGRKARAAHRGRIFALAYEARHRRHALRHPFKPLRRSLGRSPVERIRKLAHAKPEAKYVIVHADEGYTANVPLADLMLPTTLFVLQHNGEPLSPEHGCPVRLVAPHL
jgi:hypothetical protein